MTQDLQQTFIETVWRYYRSHQRNLAWRDMNYSQHQIDYRVFISEIMLQQTQVPRVAMKFQDWVARFPDFRSLADAALSDVIIAWQGLGYNRRARYIHESSKIIVSQYDGYLPKSADKLRELPGIGINTAAAMLVYAYNRPEVFIETNIRSVFLYHFFRGQSGISDRQLLDKVSESLDHENPRLWYWALMDYGSYLKKQVGNISIQSRHYAKQSKFEGSRRQLRGMVLRQLSNGPISMSRLTEAIDDQRLADVITSLHQDSLVDIEGATIRLAGS